MTSCPWTDFVHPDDIDPSISEADDLFSGSETFASDRVIDRGVGISPQFLPHVFECAHSNPSESEPFGDSTAVEAPLSNLKILLVDDQTDTREFQAFGLEQSGASVTAVASGLEVLQALDRFTPDVLLSDIGMAETNGYRLIEQIRSRSPETGSRVPAIALTAYASDFDQQQAFHAGFQKHLTKPIEPQELIEAIPARVGRAG